MEKIACQTIVIDELKINQAVLGDGEPLVLLHGWGVNVDILWPLANAMKQYGYRCYCLDLPGFGSSSVPPEPWAPVDYANFVVKFLDFHQLSSVYLFGHSFGGRIGLILGAEHSHRIRKMVLCAAAGIRPRTPLIPSIRLRLYKAIREGMLRLGLRHAAEILREQYNRRYGSADLQQVSGIMRQTFINVVNQDLADYAIRVRPSTLLFWGEQDEDTPLWMGKKLEQSIPDAGLIVYAGAGHYAYLDKLNETARVMNHFFSHD